LELELELLELELAVLGDEGGGGGANLAFFSLSCCDSAISGDSFRFLVLTSAMMLMLLHKKRTVRHKSNRNVILR